MYLLKQPVIINAYQVNADHANWSTLWIKYRIIKYSDECR